MGKRAIIASLILVSLLIGLQAIEVTNANPLPPSWMNPQMTFSIQSPLPLQTMKTYGLPVLLNFTAKCSWEFALVNTPPASPSQDWIRAFYYVLDGQDMSSASVNFTQIQTVTHANDIDHYFDYCGQAIVANLANGVHNVTIYWGVLVGIGTPYQHIEYNPSWSASSQFYVDSTFPSNSPSPTSSPTPSPTITPSPTSAPTEPPTQQPTLKPSITASPTPTAENSNPNLILEMAGVIAIVAIIVGLLVYFRRRRG